MTAAPAKVVGLGESLLRLAPPGFERLEQATTLEVQVGGAELNALIGLGAHGVDSVWLTRLADNALGRRIAAHAGLHGVTAVVQWDRAARSALYFVEHGRHPRPTEVLYDRTGSAMAGLDVDSFDWHQHLEGASVALCSGITSALSNSADAAAQAFLAAARDAQATVVFDVNHRSRLWSWTEALPVLRQAVVLVDVLFASRYDLAHLLDAAPDDDEVGVARKLMEQYGPRMVVLRTTTMPAPGQVRVTVTAVTNDDAQVSRPYDADVVDAFGAGDASLAAFVAGLVSGQDLATMVDDAAWACAFHHTIPGDAPVMRPDDALRRAVPTQRILR